MKAQAVLGRHRPSGRGSTAAKANNSRINEQNLNRATKLSQHVRVLAAKLKDISSVPRMHMVDRSYLQRLSPDLHKHAMRGTCMHTQMSYLRIQTH